MHKYVVKRILMTIPVLLGAVFLVFAIMQLTPGDPGTLILGITAKPEDIAALNHRLGADLPFFEQFFNYLKGIVLHFDFGSSYRSGKPVFDSILSRFPTTFRLALFTMLLSSLIGISLGIVSAVKQYSWLDNLLTTLAMFFSAMPGFWLGLMLMVLFSLKLRWLPFGGVDSWKSYVLPVITLSLGAAASQMRLTRSTMLETIRQDYIRTANAKGASETSVVWKHALKNALMPVVTVIGVDFGYLMGGTVLVETVFSMSGIGTLMITSIRNQDVPQIQGTILFLAVCICATMLAVDIVYAFIDPRVKLRYTK